MRLIVDPSVCPLKLALQNLTTQAEGEARTNNLTIATAAETRKLLSKQIADSAVVLERWEGAKGGCLMFFGVWEPRPAFSSRGIRTEPQAPVCRNEPRGR